MVQQIKDGYIIDFISGQEVKATPEEVDAVQVFTKQLVEDYEYPKNHIQTRPQYRVRQRPSGGKNFPVDIAVFTSQNYSFDNEYIIVECKKKNRKDGKKQLEDYLHFSKAYLGVWFNGKERLFLRKIEKGGNTFFEEIPNIPQYGQRVEDIGKFRRKDLKPTHNLKATFKAIRNHLAANTVGVTRDEVLAQQLINLIFCKIYDERFTEPNGIVTFRAGVVEEAKEVKERILDLFEKVKRKYKEVLDESDVINLDDKSIAYVVGELQKYCLIEAERDIVADAFETFIGHALKGGQGQFFTPRNVIKMMVNFLDPNDEDLIIDPACGSGGFLIEALRHVWKKLDAEGEKYHWNKNNLQEEKMEVALNKIRGIDKDYFLAKVSKAYMTIIGDGKSGIICEDSLENPQNWSDATKQKIHLGNFSVLLTNPPFGAKIPVSGKDKLKQFELGHKWKQNKKTGEWEKGRLKDNEAPQILFIERCLQLLRNGGRMAIVLPEGVYGNPTGRYIFKYIFDNSKIIAIISCPHETFQPSTHTKTSVLFLEKAPNHKKDYSFFMAIAERAGHDKNGKVIYKRDKYGNFILDKNGNKIEDDDLPIITERFKKFQKNGNKLEDYSHLGFSFRHLDIKKYILIPDYYNPEIEKELKVFETNGKYLLISVQDLLDKKIISIRRGNEIGSHFYGTGEIPFIRTTDIVNWEIKVDPVKCVAREIYEKYMKNQDIRVNDILFVNDGTFLIGRSAMVTELDKEIIIQSHIRKISVIDDSFIDPFLLFYLLNTKIVKQQVESKTFIQATLSTLGNRLNEIILPIPKEDTIKRKLSEQMKNILYQKMELRKRSLELMEL